ncbi:MAG: hypothetical protein NTW11_03500 [Candidatus Staskawiczbacteria bacterium]|nr:hypothetical protein [Candidatus Staskawiczbacteria bacterium]
MKAKKVAFWQKVLKEVEVAVNALLILSIRSTDEPAKVRMIIFNSTKKILKDALKKISKAPSIKKPGKKPNKKMDNDQFLCVHLARYYYHIESRQRGKDKCGMGILELYGMLVALKIIVNDYDGQIFRELTRGQRAVVEMKIGTPAFPPKFDLP